MKERLRLFPLMISLCLLTACGGRAGGGEMTGEELAIGLQKDFAAMTACSGQVHLTADYETRVFDYVLDVVYDNVNGATLTIVEPELARGVSAHVAAGETQLVYDDFSLDAGPITDSGISPVEAVPTFYREISQGFIAGIDLAGGLLTVTYRESGQDPGTGLETVVVFDAQSRAPITGELYWDGVRVMEAQMKDFQMMTGAVDPETPGE